MPIPFVRVQPKLHFQQISVNTPNIKFRENPTETEVLHTHSRTAITQPIVAFRNSANAPKKVTDSQTWIFLYGVIPELNLGKATCNKTDNVHTRNVTTRRVRATTAAVEKQEVLTIMTVPVFLPYLSGRLSPSFLRSIIPSCKACLVLPYISTISHKWKDFWKKKVLNKNVFWFSLLLLSATSLILWKTEQHIHN